MDCHWFTSWSRIIFDKQVTDDDEGNNDKWMSGDGQMVIDKCPNWTVEFYTGQWGIVAARSIIIAWHAQFNTLIYNLVKLHFIINGAMQIFN